MFIDNNGIHDGGPSLIVVKLLANILFYMFEI